MKDNNSHSRKSLEIVLVIIISICWCFFSFFILFAVIERELIYPLKYEKEIVELSNKYQLDKALIFSVVNVESKFNKKAVSKKDAKGLMQLTENTAKFIATKLNIEKYDLFDVRTNIEFGCFYIRYLIDKFEVVDTAIVAYNAGEGNVKAWLTNIDYSKDGKNLEYIPFKESREYLIKIRKTFEKYRNIYGDIVDK